MHLREYLLSFHREDRAKERERLAQHLEVEISSLRSWEIGRRIPKAALLRKLEYATSYEVTRFDMAPHIYPFGYLVELIEILIMSDLIPGDAKEINKNEKT